MYALMVSLDTRVVTEGGETVTEVVDGRLRVEFSGRLRIGGREVQPPAGLLATWWAAARDLRREASTTPFEDWARKCMAEARAYDDCVAALDAWLVHGAARGRKLHEVAAKLAPGDGAGSRSDGATPSGEDPVDRLAHKIRTLCWKDVAASAAFEWVGTSCRP